MTPTENAAHVITTAQSPFTIVAVRAYHRPAARRVAALPRRAPLWPVQTKHHSRFHPSPLLSYTPTLISLTSTLSPSLHLSLTHSQVNQAWVELCGYTSAEAVGRTCRILQGPETSLPILSDLHAAITKRRSTVVRGQPCTPPAPP